MIHWWKWHQWHSMYTIHIAQWCSYTVRAIVMNRRCLVARWWPRLEPDIMCVERTPRRQPSHLLPLLLFGKPGFTSATPSTAPNVVEPFDEMLYFFCFVVFFHKVSKLLRSWNAVFIIMQTFIFSRPFCQSPYAWRTDSDVMGNVALEPIELPNYI